MKYALTLAAIVVATPVAAATDMSHAEFFQRSSTGNWTQPLSYETFAPPAPRYTTKRVVTRDKRGRRIVRTVRVQQDQPRIHIARTQSNLRKQAVADMVAAETARQIGSQWVPTALKLAKIESSFNCGAVGPRTRHGHARGVLQVMPGSARALGYDPRRLNECQYGISAGVAHMASCIQSGVRTHTQMASCHVAGVKGWKVKLNRRAEKYKNQYIRMASLR
jgi:hypothetical protein